MVVKNSNTGTFLKMQKIQNFSSHMLNSNVEIM